MQIMRKCVAEAIGTFCLVFAGTGAIVINDLRGGPIGGVGVALTFGLVVMAMIYALADVSGAHFNPAVSIAAWLSGRFNRKDLVPYLISQLGGALAASVMLRLLFPEHETLGATHPQGSWMQSFLLELLLTAILMFVILNVSCSNNRTSLAGVAIGGVVALEALFAGPICGASMNPARSFAPALVSGQLNDIAIYILGPILGAFIGALGCFGARGETCCGGKAKPAECC